MRLPIGIGCAPCPAQRCAPLSGREGLSIDQLTDRFGRFAFDLGEGLLCMSGLQVRRLGEAVVVADDGLVVDVGLLGFARVNIQSYQRRIRGIRI